VLFRSVTNPLADAIKVSTANLVPGNFSRENIAVRFKNFVESSTDFDHLVNDASLDNNAVVVDPTASFKLSSALFNPREEFPIELTALLYLFRAEVISCTESDALSAINYLFKYTNMSFCN
jgi:hypothetical protein